jgi:hypothetical protein
MLSFLKTLLFGKIYFVVCKGHYFQYYWVEHVKACNPDDAIIQVKTNQEDQDIAVEKFILITLDEKFAYDKCFVENSKY